MRSGVPLQDMIGWKIYLLNRLRGQVGLILNLLSSDLLGQEWKGFPSKKLGRFMVRHAFLDMVERYRTWVDSS